MSPPPRNFSRAFFWCRCGCIQSLAEQQPQHTPVAYRDAEEQQQMGSWAAVADGQLGACSPGPTGA